MCLAKIHLNDESGTAFKDIAVLRIEGGTIRLRSLFGEEKEIAGRVKEINFQNSTVLVVTTA
jgi:predicted RNA-binding protein